MNNKEIVVIKGDDTFYGIKPRSKTLYVHIKSNCFQFSCYPFSCKPGVDGSHIKSADDISCHHYSTKWAERERAEQRKEPAAGLVVSNIVVI